MLLGDWLILTGWTLLILGISGWTLLLSGVTGWTPPNTSRGRSSIRGAMSTLLRWQPDGSRPAALRVRAAQLRVDAHDLTDYVCRLADGSIGRVAIIAGTDEDWTAICVPVQRLDTPDAE